MNEGYDDVFMLEWMDGVRHDERASERKVRVLHWAGMGVGAGGFFLLLYIKYWHLFL